jgi:hypothetical protein
LAELVKSENWTALKTCIQSCLPLAWWFNLTVFDENLTQINSALICSGGQISDKVGAADYVCASTGGDFAVYTLRLQLAGLD